MLLLDQKQGPLLIYEDDQEQLRYLKNLFRPLCD